MPSSAALTDRILQGDILPDTVIFDAGRGIWCRAAEAPLVRFIVEVSIERPELKGWAAEADMPADVPVAMEATNGEFLAALEALPDTTPVATASPATVARPPAVDAVAALLDRIAPLSQTPEPPAQPRVAAIPQPERAVAPQPAPVAPVPANEAQRPTSDWIPDWELGPEVESGEASLELVGAGAGVGVGGQRRGWKRTQVVATSLVGGVSAMVALGVLLQGREASADELTDPSLSMMPAAPMTFEQIPESELSTVGTAAGEIDTTPEPKVASEAPAPPKAPPAPTLQIPEMPALGETLVATDIVRPTTTSGLVALPTPPRPTRDPNAERPTQLPQVRNASRVQQALDREYPIGLRELGVGGRVELSFYINERGVVEQFEIKESSGNVALDQAALRIAPVFEFTPAMRGRERMAVWFSSGITFGRVTSGTASGVASTDGRTPSAQGTTDAPDQPTATQFDVAPVVRNANQVRQALEREYPIGLRATGVGGPVEVWFYVDAQGKIEQSRLKKSSGNIALDQAALKVAQVFQFNPGQRGNERVPGWFSFRIVFDPMTSGQGSARQR